MQKKGFRKLAAAVAAAAALSIGMTSLAAGSYTVENGDFLRKIAEKELGDQEKWSSIYEANRDIIKNPNLIYPGQVLTMPDGITTPQPEASVPETPAQPEASVPETPAQPEMSVPETPAQPETSVPETPAQPETSVPETPAQPEASVPETPAAEPALMNEWVDLLYVYLLADNYQAVMQHVVSVANVQLICAGYEYAGWARSEEIAYRLMASDGKIFWIVVSRPGTAEGTVPFIYVVLSEVPGDNFEEIKLGYRYVWLTEDQTTYAYTTAGTHLIIHLATGNTTTALAESTTPVKSWRPVSVAKKRLISIRYYQDGKMYVGREFSYDSQGNMIKETTYFGQDNVCTGWIEWSCDNEGSWTIGTTYNDMGVSTGWAERSYDSRGDVVKEIRYDGRDGSVKEWYAWSYDDRGNVVKKESDWGAGPQCIEWKYDNEGKRIEGIFYRGENARKYRYEYDNGGNTEREIDAIGKENSWTEYTYE